MTGFTESDVEDAVLDWLEGLGWQALHGPDIAPDAPGTEGVDYGEVVLERRRRDVLALLNPGLPAAALDDAFRNLTRPEWPALEARNRAYNRMLVDGATVEYREDGGTVRGDAGVGCSLVTSVVCTCKGGSSEGFLPSTGFFVFCFRIL